MTEFTRRAALAGAAAIAAVPLSVVPGKAAAPQIGKQAPGIYRYKVGSIDLDARQAPGVGTQCADARLEPGFQEAVVLLHVLRLQQHALGPDDFAIPRHGCLAREGKWDSGALAAHARDLLFVGEREFFAEQALQVLVGVARQVAVELHQAVPHARLAPRRQHALEPVWDRLLLVAIPPRGS